jgi:hypothetical protein
MNFSFCSKPNDHHPSKIDAKPFMQLYISVDDYKKDIELIEERRKGPWIDWEDVKDSI